MQSLPNGIILADTGDLVQMSALLPLMAQSISDAIGYTIVDESSDLAGFEQPRKGMKVYVESEDREYRWRDNEWVVSDTGWIDVPLNPGFSYQGGEPFQVRNKDGVVKLRWGVSNSGLTASSQHALATLPADIPRPTNSVYAPVASNTAANIGRGYIPSSGIIYLTTGTSVGSYYLFDSMVWFEG